ncbi:MAG: citrate lyase subunit beta / citryl-CoA lyase [Thermoleophilaceae bacterium]|nr:citrate lyase subunit beta / citryl-CoA lyase [Thermoleophilaceae bacterium]
MDIPLTAPRDIAAARSFLFVPGDDDRKVRSALRAGGTLLLDLEDAVAPDRKADARATVEKALADGRGDATVLLRINGERSRWFAADLEWAHTVAADGIVLPKAEPAGIGLLESSGLPVVALIESAQGLRSAYEIAAAEPVVRLALGSVDLAADLGTEQRADGLELLVPRATLVRDSAAAGLPGPVDGVWTALDDDEGLRRDTALARTLGMAAKLCIHPRQIAIVESELQPSAELVEWARGVLDRADDAADQGVIAADGEMIDAAVVARARRVLHGAPA